MAKYVDMVDGCTFVSEDMDEAMDHMKEHHGDMPDAKVAEVTADDEGVSCKTAA